MTSITQIEELIAVRITKLMKEGKVSRSHSWQLKSIVNKIGEEFGVPYEDWAYKYILEYCGIWEEIYVQ